MNFYLHLPTERQVIGEDYNFVTKQCNNEKASVRMKTREKRPLLS